MNNTINRMMIGTSLIGITFSLNITDAYAEACRRVPSCAEMGFVATSCPSGTATLKCPFDLSKVFCAKDCDGYSLTSCPANADCEQCWDGKYKKLNCKEGYLAEGDDCVVNPCEGYPLTALPAHCSTYLQCQSGPTIKYRCNNCENGYVPSKMANYSANPFHAEGYSECMENPCYLNQTYSVDANGNMTYYDYRDWGAKYKLTSKSDANCKNSNSYNECKSGNTTYYACHSCISNYFDPFYHQRYYSSMEGKCFYGNNTNCPSSKHWSSSKSTTGTVGWESCYVSSSSVYYRDAECKDGYHLDYQFHWCVKNE